VRLGQFGRHVAGGTGIGQPSLQLIQRVLLQRRSRIVLFLLHLHLQAGQFRRQVGGGLRIGLKVGDRGGDTAWCAQVGGYPDHGLHDARHLGGGVGAL